MRDVKSANSKRQIFRKGEVKGLKRGILIGSISTMLIAGMGHLGYTNLAIKRTTPSFEVGFEVPSEYTYRTNDKKNFWYDFSAIASEFDPETMDIDSFIYGCYCHFYTDTRLDNMDSLLGCLHARRYTDNENFVDYCDARGLTEEKDGKIIINEKKYRQVVKDYMENINKQQDLEQEVSGFRRG